MSNNIIFSRVNKFMFFGVKLYLGNIIVFARSPFLFMYIFPLIVNIIPFAERLLMRMI